MLTPSDIAAQGFALAPFETVSVYCVKEAIDPNHIPRVTGRLVTLSDGTKYVCGPNSIVRIGPGSAYRTLEEAVSFVGSLIACSSQS